MNYSSNVPPERPTKPSDKAIKASDGDFSVRTPRRRNVRSVIVVIAIAVAAACGIGYGAFRLAGGSTDGQETAQAGKDGSAEATVDGKAKASSAPVSIARGKLGDAIDLEAVADDGNGMSAGGLGVTVKSVSLAADDAGRGWLDVEMTVTNAGTKDVALGSDGLELLASQGDYPMAWDSGDLETWESTKLGPGEAKDLSMHLALSSTTEPVTLAVSRDDSVLGWTVDVSGAAKQLGVAEVHVSASTDDGK